MRCRRTNLASAPENRPREEYRPDHRRLFTRPPSDAELITAGTAGVGSTLLCIWRKLMSDLIVGQEQCCIHTLRI
jgi:hypothetical protein